MSKDPRNDREILKEAERVLQASNLTINDVQTLVGKKAQDMMDLLSEIARGGGTVRQALVGQITGVATTAVRFPSFRCVKGVLFKAHGGNAGMVYIANHDNLLNAGGPQIGGFELDANQSATVPLRILEDWYMYDVPGGQIISIIAM